MTIGILSNYVKTSFDNIIRAMKDHIFCEILIILELLTQMKIAITLRFHKSSSFVCQSVARDKA